MDKLEFDARLAQLERRVGLLSALILGGVCLVAFSGLFLVRMSAKPIPPATAFVSTPAPHHMATTPSPMIQDYSEGSVGNLANQLRDLADLHKRSLLTGDEYEAKKAQLLEKPLRSSDLKSELEFVSDLQRRNVITSDEFQTIKKKILQIGK
jgi:hypothetical protein